MKTFYYLYIYDQKDSHKIFIAKKRKATDISKDDVNSIKLDNGKGFCVFLKTRAIFFILTLFKTL
jgi:hypothetical protein